MSCAWRGEAKNDRLHPLWAFVAYTGVRRGEALGLSWQDVDLEAGSATIVQSRTAVNHRPVLSDTKTSAGRRTVKLDAETVAMLRRHRKHQNEERLQLGTGWEAAGFVFCAADGQPLHPDHASSAFKRRVRRWGFPYLSIQGLRHTWATLAMRAGVHPRVVQERLGHSNITVTMQTYSHVAPVMHEEAAELVASMFRR